MGVVLAPLCSCGSALSPFDPRYTQECARNCGLWHSPEQHEFILTQMLQMSGVM